MADYTLTADDLTRIRGSLTIAAEKYRDVYKLPAEAQRIEELRDRFYGTEAIGITYPSKEG